MSLCCCFKVLSRADYLLRTGMAFGALEPLLALLHSIALGGGDMARAICAEPGLVQQPWHTPFIVIFVLVLIGIDISIVACNLASVSSMCSSTML
jgi:hypothetical protein